MLRFDNRSHHQRAQNSRKRRTTSRLARWACQETNFSSIITYPSRGAGARTLERPLSCATAAVAPTRTWVNTEECFDECRGVERTTRREAGGRGWGAGVTELRKPHVRVIGSATFNGHRRHSQGWDDRYALRRVQVRHDAPALPPVQTEALQCLEHERSRAAPCDDRKKI